MRETYIADGLVRSIYFHFPILAEESALAAEYSDCVGEQGSDQFWEFVDGVYERQDEIGLPLLAGLA